MFPLSKSFEIYTQSHKRKAQFNFGLYHVFCSVIMPIFIVYFCYIIQVKITLNGILSPKKTVSQRVKIGILLIDLTLPPFSACHNPGGSGNSLIHPTQLADALSERGCTPQWRYQVLFLRDVEIEQEIQLDFK